MIIKGVVVGIIDYGVFLKFPNDYTGLLHISQIGKKFIKDLNKYFAINQEIYVKVIATDEENKRYSLSTIDVDYHTGEKFKYYNNGFYILKKNLPNWVDEKVAEYNLEIKN